MGELSRPNPIVLQMQDRLPMPTLWVFMVRLSFYGLVLRGVGGTPEHPFLQHGLWVRDKRKRCYRTSIRQPGCEERRGYGPEEDKPGEARLTLP